MRLTVRCTIWHLGLSSLLLVSPAFAQAPVSELVQAAKSGGDGARIKAIDDLAAQKEKAAAAVAPLTELLKDASPEVRAHAANALGEIGAPARSAAEALSALLKDGDQSVRRQAVESIASIRPGSQVMIPIFIKLMEDPDPGVRQRILQAVSAAGVQAVPSLIEGLKNEKAAYWACLILRDMGPIAKDAVPALTEQLKNPRLEIRREAALALGAIGADAKSALPALASLLDDSTGQEAATFVMGQIGQIPPSAEPKVRANIKSDNKVLSTISLWALARVHPKDAALAKEAAEQIIGRLQDQDPFVRVSAARALSALQLDPAITFPIFEKVLENADPTTVRHALDALATLGARAVPRLTAALKHEPLRVQAAYTLGQIGPEAAPATAALAELLSSNSPTAANEAAMALAKIGPAAKASVPALVAALEKPECDSAHAIMYALGKMGSEAKAAKPALVKRIADPATAVLAGWALVEVDPSGPEVSSVAMPALIAGLSDESPEKRQLAAQAIGDLKSVPANARAALEKAIQDSDPGVKATAAQALQALRGGAGK
jgi:HEAT repeat protein